MPKSEILRFLFSATRMLRQARSRWTISRLARYSYGRDRRKVFKVLMETKAQLVPGNIVRPITDTQNIAFITQAIVNIYCSDMY